LRGETREGFKGAVVLVVGNAVAVTIQLPLYLLPGNPRIECRAAIGCSHWAVGAGNSFLAGTSRLARRLPRRCAVAEEELIFTLLGGSELHQFLFGLALDAHPLVD